jgi:hypothetical protein
VNIDYPQAISRVWGQRALDAKLGESPQFRFSEHANQFFVSILLKRTHWKSLRIRKKKRMMPPHLRRGLF